MKFNQLINSKFKHCTQIGVVEETNIGIPIKVYELPASVLEPAEVGLVGINDGSTCWVAHRDHCLHKMKKVNIPPSSVPRARLLSPTTTTRRKLLHV